MVRLSRYFSFVLLVIAMLLSAVWLEAHRVFKRVKAEMTGAVTATVYLNEGAGEEDIQNLRNRLASYSEISIKSFTTSKDAIERLSSDLDISEQLKLVEDDFTLPASFELSLNLLDATIIKNIFRQIEDNEIVQAVEVPVEVIRRGQGLLTATFKTLILSGILILGAAFILFLSSGFLYLFKERDKIILGSRLGVGGFRLAMNGFGGMFLSGVIAGLFAVGTLSIVSPYFNLFGSVLLVLSGGFISGISYIANVLILLTGK